MKNIVCAATTHSSNTRQLPIDGNLDDGDDDDCHDHVDDDDDDDDGDGDVNNGFANDDGKNDCHRRRGSQQKAKTDHLQTSKLFCFSISKIQSAETVCQQGQKIWDKSLNPKVQAQVFIYQS